jgi:hypothetical protein
MLINDRFGWFKIYFDKDDDGPSGKDDEEAEDVEDEEENPDEDEESEEDEEPIEEWDPERAKSTILKQRAEEKRLKQENKKTAARLAKFEKAEKEREEADKTELQKLTERAETAEASDSDKEKLLKKERIQRHVEIEAYKMGFVDPSDAYDLLVANAKIFEMIEYDTDDGSVSGHLKALKELSEQTQAYQA